MPRSAAADHNGWPSVPTAIWQRSSEIRHMHTSAGYKAAPAAISVHDGATTTRGAGLEMGDLAFDQELRGGQPRAVKGLKQGEFHGGRGAISAV